MIKIFRVIGSSMEPTLSDGDYVVAATRVWRPRIDQLAVVRHPDYGVLVKRIHRQFPEGYTVSSDNPLGTDSRTLGVIPEGLVVGPVLFTIRQSVDSSQNSEKSIKEASA
jgi:phage repressor protein C with HTH and peptisase S24 domain